MINTRDAAMGSLFFRKQSWSSLHTFVKPCLFKPPSYLCPGQISNQLNTIILILFEPLITSSFLTLSYPPECSEVHVTCTHMVGQAHES